MAIAIKCPHCQTGYSLKDDLAGKRVTCRTCRKPFPVPAPVAAPANPADADAMAAAAFADEQPPPAVKAVETAAIKVKCPHCDFENSFEASLAGKNRPCQNDECRKILKVPLPKKVDPKDWRKAGADKPSAAKAEDPGFEGAWSASAATAVSRDALKRAEAIGVDEEEPRSPWQKIKFGVLALAVLGLIGFGVVWGVHKWSAKQQRGTMELALEYIDPKSKKPADAKLPAEPARLIAWQAGVYELSKQNAAAARKHLDEARTLGTQSPEKTAAMIEMAAAYSDLGGSKDEADRNVRQEWDKEKVFTNLRAMVGQLSAPGDDGRDARSYAMHLLARRLIKRGQEVRAEQLAKSITSDDAPEMLGAVGLELLAQGQRDKAEQIALSTDNLQNREIAPSLLALWLALGSADADPAKAKSALDKATKIAPPPGNGELTRMVRVGYAEGLARQGKLNEARTLAWRNGDAIDRLRAGAAVAAAVVDSKPGDHDDLKACALFLEGELKGRQVPLWLMMRLTQLSARAGRADLGEKFAATIADPGLKAWAQLLALRAKLKATEGRASEDLAKDVGTPKQLANSMAYSAIARHNARAGSASAETKEVRDWPVEQTRPFGYAGIALADVEDDF